MTRRAKMRLRSGLWQANKAGIGRRLPIRAVIGAKVILSKILSHKTSWVQMFTASTIRQVAQMALRSGKKWSRSINDDFKQDLKAARKLWLPWRLLLPLMALCVPAFWLFDHFGLFNMALPALNCVGMFGVLIYLKRDISQKPWFWLTILILVAIHAALIWYVPWTDKWVPALSVAFISSADFCLILWILAFVKRLVERGSLR
jgi:hypothetical protein